MNDHKYCYPNSNVLINKLNIRDANELKETEADITLIRLQYLELKPIVGKFDFNHLKKIHKYIFQDIYSWAGKVRTVEISKGNSFFCTTRYLQDYATEIFNAYYKECKATADNREKFINTLTKHYADLNALHPFREGNGRTQREFARTLCLKCGYIFDLSQTKYKDMLNASICSFQTGDNSKLKNIFQTAIIPIMEYTPKETTNLKILSIDDLKISKSDYNYYEDGNSEAVKKYDAFYKGKIKQLKDKKQSFTR